MYADKLLPHDIEAEEAVIGALLIDGECFPRVAPLVKAEDFYREKHAACFRAARSVWARGESLDQVTLANQLNRSGELEVVGGMAYLSQLVAITPTSAHSEHYARIVARAATMRELIDAGGKIAAIGYESADEADDAIRQAEGVLFSVKGDLSRTGYVPLRAIYDAYLEGQADAIDDLGESIRHAMPTGFSEIDELLGGLQRADMVVLGARPSVGKSALAINIATEIAAQDQTVAICSLEMSREQIALRILADRSEVNSYRLRLGLYSEAEEQRVIDAIGRLSELPVFIDDGGGQTVNDIRANAQRQALEHGLDLLVVDYLQLVRGHSRGMENRVQQVTEISWGLKELARELNACVLVCSQLNRLVANRPGHRPQLSDLRDSGSIEQDADVVMFINRDELNYSEEQWEELHPGRAYPEGEVDIIVAKHRNGPVGSLPMRFRRDLARFESRDSPLRAVPQALV